MDSNIEILNKLKTTLKENLKHFMKFADNNYTEVITKDGKKMQIVGDMSVGNEAYFIDENGMQTPVEDGEYALESGLTIKITSNKIEEVSESKEEITDTETEDMSKCETMEDMPASPEDSTATEADNSGNEKIAMLEEKIAILEEAIKSIMDFINTQGQANEQMMSRIEVMASSPAAEPVKQAKKVHTLSSNNTITKGDMDEIRKMKEMFSDKGITFPG